MKKLFLIIFILVFGSLEISAQIIFIPPAPSISAQPASPVSYCRNIQASIPFTASGLLLIYQWSITGPPGCEFCDSPLTNNATYSGTNTNSLGINTGLLTPGTYYYFCTVSNTGGSVYTITVQFTVLTTAAPNAPTTTGAAICGSGALTLSAAGGTAGQYRWYTVATGGTPIAGQTNATYTTPTLTGTTNYYVAINNGICEGVRTIVTATINTIPSAPTTTGNSLCGNGTVTLSAAGGTAGQYRWYTVASGGTAIAGQTNATYTTPTLTGTTNYYVAINNGICEGSRTIVTATINTIPSSPTTTGSSLCGNGTVTLSAVGGTAGQYRWYTVATGGTAIAGQTNATYTTPTLTGTTDYYVAINNGFCEGSRTIVTATINTIPSAPTTTGNSLCGSGTMTLSAAGGTAGQYRWYTVATGGTAIAGQTNATYTTSTLTGTTNYYVAINNGFCEGSRTIVTATINTIPSAPTTTGSSLCGSGTMTLSAAGGTAGQYRWYTVATGGPAIAGQTNATYTTPTLTGTTNYYVAINNGFCEGPRIIVTATINSIPAAPTTTGNSSCFSASLLLTATGASNGQYRWYTSSSGGTPISGQTNSTYTTPVLASTTIYYVAINNGFCEGARSSVTAEISSNPTPPTTTGASRCGAGSVTLNAAGSVNQYRWYTVSTGGTAIAGQVSSTYATPAITNTTTYYVSINNGTCESSRTPVIATINTPPSAPTAIGNSSCGTSDITLNASGGTAGQYRWYTAPTGGAAITGQTNSAYTTPLINTTTTYYVSINNGTCESSRTAVDATINPLPTAPASTGNSSCGPISITLNASGSTAGQYRWYTVPTGGTAITGETNSSYSTPVISTTTTYYVSINNGTCESARTSVTATIQTTGCNTIPPAISQVPLATIVAGEIVLDLVPLITAPGVLNVNSISIINPPSSGASASISNGILTIDYAGKKFTGTESIKIRACDESNLCTEQTFSIEVAGDINVYNGMSPNNDGKNEIFKIQYIDVIPGMEKNKVSILNRWGNVVFDVDGYNNTTRVFKGLGNNGEALPSGTYFYKITFDDPNLKNKTGYLVIKH